MLEDRLILIAAEGRVLPRLVPQPRGRKRIELGCVNSTKEKPSTREARNERRWGAATPTGEGPIRVEAVGKTISKRKNG